MGKNLKSIHSADAEDAEKIRRDVVRESNVGMSLVSQGLLDA
jgi:hypothetical protein